MGVSVVRADSRRRWLAVAVVTGLLLGAPTIWHHARQALTAARAGTAGDPAGLVDRVLASTAVPHHGLVDSRGGISLPDLPRLGRVTALAGGTVRARVWWASPTRWRVDTLSSTGERGSYRRDDELVTWDYEDDTVALERAADGVRLPRVADLLPGDVARRLLGGAGPADRVEAAPGPRLVAGRTAWSLSVVPGDPRSTLTRIELAVDDATGLPLEVTVRGPGSGVALTTRYREVSFEPLPAGVVDPPAPAGAARQTRDRPDLVAEIDRTGPWRLPGTLAGLPRTASVTDAGAGTDGGAATYGQGLTRFVVLPLPTRLSARVRDAVRTAGAARAGIPGGEVAELRSGVLGVVVAAGSDGEHAYLISGPVSGGTLRDAAAALLASPPGRRG